MNLLGRSSEKSESSEIKKLKQRIRELETQIEKGIFDNNHNNNDDDDDGNDDEEELDDRHVDMKLRVSRVLRQVNRADNRNPSTSPNATRFHLAITNTIMAHHNMAFSEDTNNPFCFYKTQISTREYAAELAFSYVLKLSDTVKMFICFEIETR